MRTAAEALRGGGTVSAAEAAGLRTLAEAGFGKIDYFETRGADDLRRLGPGPIDAAARVFAAARLGKARLIDNWPV